MRQKAGEEPGNEARLAHNSYNSSIFKEIQHYQIQYNVQGTGNVHVQFIKGSVHSTVQNHAFRV